MIKVGILGATGSIGRQALEEVRAHKELFSVVLVSAYSNATLLSSIISEFQPEIAVFNGTLTCDLGVTKIYSDLQSLNNPEIYANCDVVLNGIGGFAGLLPSVAVLTSVATLATANKESIVSAGKFLNAIAKQNNKRIIPVDSEHSAIFQCLAGENGIKKLILTASGGAFREFSKQELAKVSAERALAHPTWKMGKKVTIDSATLMNKGLEIIEAKHLFGEDIDIEPIIHRESIVHALVEFKDGFMKALLSVPDMRLPIRYALSGGSERIYSDTTVNLDLIKCGKLTFEAPDRERFPCLAIGEQVAGNLELGVVLVAADEIAVNRFLAGKLDFYGIPKLINDALKKFGDVKAQTLDDVLCIENAVKEYITYKY